MPAYIFLHPEKPESTVRIDKPTAEEAKRVYRLWYPNEPDEPVEAEQKEWSETT